MECAYAIINLSLTFVPQYDQQISKSFILLIGQEKDIAKAERYKQTYFIKQSKGKDMETLKLIDFDEVKDMALGKVGTPSRDEYEREYSEWKRREDEERAI